MLQGKTPSKRPSKLDEHRGRIDELLKTFPDITAQRIFEELRAAGFAGGYTGVKTLVRTVRPKPGVTPSLETTVYGPAELAENDWSPYRIAFTPAPHRILQGFSCVLVNSHRKRHSFHDRADLHALMDGHVKAFTALGGLALSCKCWLPVCATGDWSRIFADGLAGNSTLVTPVNVPGEVAESGE